MTYGLWLFGSRIVLQCQRFEDSTIEVHEVVRNSHAKLADVFRLTILQHLVANS